MCSLCPTARRASVRHGGQSGECGGPSHRLSLRLGALRLSDGEVRCDRRAILPVPQRRGCDGHLRACTTATSWRYYPTVGIVQSGSPGSYTYSVSYNASAWNSYALQFPEPLPLRLAAANDCPIFDVTWGDAARFCNWLQNGQPTELRRGCRLDGDRGVHAQRGNNQSASWDDAQHGGDLFHPLGERMVQGGVLQPDDGTYWTYPTQSNTAPINALSATGTNNANFYDITTRQRWLHRPDELPDAGGRVRGLSRPLRHVRHGRRRFSVE